MATTTVATLLLARVARRVLAIALSCAWSTLTFLLGSMRGEEVMDTVAENTVKAPERPQLERVAGLGEQLQ